MILDMCLYTWCGQKRAGEEGPCSTQCKEFCPTDEFGRRRWTKGELPTIEWLKNKGGTKFGLRVLRGLPQCKESLGTDVGGSEEKG